MRLAALAVVVAVTLPKASGAQRVAEPDSHRMDDYHAPVPDSLTGGTVIWPGAHTSCGGRTVRRASST